MTLAGPQQSDAIATTGRTTYPVGGFPWAVVQFGNVTGLTLKFEATGNSRSSTPVYTKVPAYSAAGVQTPADTSLSVSDNTMLWVAVGGNDLVLNTSAVVASSPLVVTPTIVGPPFVTSVGGGGLSSDVNVAQTGGVAMVKDDDAFAVATSYPYPPGFLADETAPDSVNEGDIGVPRMTLERIVRAVVAYESSFIQVAGSQVTPTFTTVAAASSGNNTLVTNTNAGKKIRVFQMALVAASAVNLYFTGDNSGTVVFGGSTNKINLAANGGFVLPFSPVGWFDCATDTDLVMNLSGAVAVSGGVVTAEV